MELERNRLASLGFAHTWITKHLGERHARDITQSFEHWVENFLDVLSTCEDDNVHKLFKPFTESVRRRVAGDWACHADCGLTQHLVEWVRGRLYRPSDEFLSTISTRVNNTTTVCTHKRLVTKTEYFDDEGSRADARSLLQCTSCGIHWERKLCEWTNSGETVYETTHAP